MQPYAIVSHQRDVRELRRQLAERETSLAMQDFAEERSRSVFLLTTGGRHFALPLNLVTEVLPMAALTHVTGQTAPVIGWLERRARWFAVIDLAMSAGAPAPTIRAENYLVLCDHPTGPVALRAEPLGDVVGVDGMSLAALPASANHTPHLVAALCTTPSSLLVSVGVLAANLASLPAPGAS
jgi:chemotaxis signal transduction protein